jgi:hypothetical protein
VTPTTMLDDLTDTLNSGGTFTLSLAHEHVIGLVDTISRSGNPSEAFFYLGGPMTGVPKSNFPRFHHVATALRGRGYNIISPAELDDPEVEAAALASPDGFLGESDIKGFSYEHFLARDLIICAMPACIGGIFLEGWQHSRGARGESWVLQFLKKQLLEYDEFDGSPVLTAITHRDDRLTELGVDPQGVPLDAPGILTVEAKSV